MLQIITHPCYTCTMSMRYKIKSEIITHSSHYTFSCTTWREWYSHLYSLYYALNVLVEGYKKDFISRRIINSYQKNFAVAVDTEILGCELYICFVSFWIKIAWYLSPFSNIGQICRNSIFLLKFHLALHHIMFFNYISSYTKQ